MGRGRGRARRMRRMVAGVAVVLLTGGLLGCSSSGDSAYSQAATTYDDSATSGEMESAPADSSDWDMDSGSAARDESAEMPAFDSADDADGSGSAAGEGSASAGPIVGERDIIRTAQLTITVPVDPAAGKTRPSADELADAAAEKARAIRSLARLPGAYVSGSDGFGSDITITLRIPVGSYDSVMDRIGEIGKITERYESTTDVTGELVDVAARITSQQASVDRLRGLMAEAQSMKDVIAIESELSRREADLDALKQSQAGLKDLVALSTISVTVTAVPAPVEELEEPPAERSAFMRGLLAGWDAMVAFGSGVAVVVGALLPFTPLIVVGLLVLWWAVRRMTRTTRDRGDTEFGAAADSPKEASEGGDTADRGPGSSTIPNAESAGQASADPGTADPQTDE